MVSTLNHNAKAYHIYIHSLYWFHNAWSPLNSIALASCVRIVCRLAELVHWLYQRLLHSTLMWWPPVIAFTGKPLYQLIFCKILDARKFWSCRCSRRRLNDELILFQPYWADSNDMQMMCIIHNTKNKSGLQANSLSKPL